ncbi:ubiquitin-conjugating enzyme E2 [Trypanosoma grayi]|uniref:ubiquitin-conjugating enzyme E2 n=1 Tax=Trypanosoma grayi TaxID=71804 RepID=UPI0004F453B2|nr:ubiquitin-conjugating enzyme E2 [Trypanosoma grayi]KEG13706.1 ubiquitin-conjugating enzyme E2 [Trypanosoma grayi]
MASVQSNCSASSRLQKEFMELMMGGAEGISAFPQNDNLFHWIGTVQGVPNTVYEGLEFQLSLIFSANYPFEAPVVRFLTPCFHPNVDAHGGICLDILKEKWSAVYTVSKILLSIQSLLDNPNNHSPLNNRAAGLWYNKEAYRCEVLLAYKDAKPNAS